MKILVTGSHGFVGRRFVHRLSNDGHKVICVDDMSAGQDHHDWLFQPNSKNCEFHFQDVRDFMRGHRCSDFELVIHCAATVGGRRLIDGEPLAVATNMSIDSELFYWATHERNYFGLYDKPKRMPKLVYFSSSAVYPAALQTRQKHGLLSEDLVHLGRHIQNMPEGTYGFGKLVGEYLACVAARHHGLHVAVYRPFGGYGEDQSADYPFPSILKRILEGQTPIEVWGSGNQARDFIFIDDIVDAVLATYESIPSAKALNLGTGIATTFMELGELMLDRLGRSGTIVNKPGTPEGVFYRVADAHEMLKLYTPKYPLEIGIDHCANVMKNRLTKAKVTV